MIMRNTIMVTLIGASLATQAGCATKSGTGAAGGAVGGAAVGGLIGGTEGAIVGAALGGILGYGVGRHMEEQDRRRMAYAIEANQPVQWQNPETGYQYQVQPTRTYYQDDGRQCRSFRMLAEVDGRPDELNGVACRGPDGSWQMQN